MVLLARRRIVGYRQSANCAELLQGRGLSTFVSWLETRRVGERWLRSEEESRRNETMTKKKKKRGEERKEKGKNRIKRCSGGKRGGGVVVAWQMRGEAFRSRKSKDIDTITLPRANYQSA